MLTSKPSVSSGWRVVAERNRDFKSVEVEVSEPTPHGGHLIDSTELDN